MLLVNNLLFFLISITSKIINFLNLFENKEFKYKNINNELN